MTDRPSRPRARAAWLLTAAVLAFALLQASRLRWVGDDAFISYRYAENLVQGAGLVYNPGERVEGFSNFLWTLFLAVPLAAGGDPVLASQVLGIAAYACTLLLLVACSTWMPGRGFPLAAAGFGLQHHAQVFATGGLETALFTLLVTAVVAAVIEARTPRGYAAASTLGLLAALTRPDGAIFLLWPLLGVTLDRRVPRRASCLLAAVLPALAGYGLYLVWKLQYFGDVLPNTFYAKSAGLSRYPQGLTYLWLYFKSYWVLLASAAAPLLLLGKGEAKSGSPWRTPRGVVLLAGACVLYLLFVARVGGDFMFARFVLPVTPILLLLLEAVVSCLRGPGLQWAAGLLVVAAIGTARFPTDLVRLDNATGIVEERSFYPRERVEEARAAGEELRRALAGTGARVAIFGSQAMLAYYARLPYALEAHTGLTDRAIARRTLQARGRVGHEKAVGRDYLRKREVDFVLDFGLFRGQPPPPYRIRLGDTTGTIVSYRPHVMQSLRGRPGVEFVPFEAYLDRYLTRLPDLPPARVRDDYAEFKAFYFDHTQDESREAPFRVAR